MEAARARLISHCRRLAGARCFRAGQRALPRRQEWCRKQRLEPHSIGSSAGARWRTRPGLCQLLAHAPPIERQFSESCAVQNLLNQSHALASCSLGSRLAVRVRGMRRQYRVDVFGRALRGSWRRRWIPGRATERREPRFGGQYERRNAGERRRRRERRGDRHGRQPGLLFGRSHLRRGRPDDFGYRVVPASARVL